MSSISCRQKSFRWPAVWRWALFPNIWWHSLSSRICVISSRHMYILDAIEGTYMNTVHYTIPWRWKQSPVQRELFYLTLSHCVLLIIKMLTEKQNCADLIYWSLIQLYCMFRLFTSSAIIRHQVTKRIGGRHLLTISGVKPYTVVISIIP